MKTQSIDTAPKAEKVLIDLYRQASPAKKFALVRSMSETMMQLSRRAIVRANEGLSEREIDILFVEYHYGKELALKLKEYLQKNEKSRSTQSA